MTDATQNLPVFQMLSHYGLAHAIFAAFEAGLWGPFQSNLDYVFDPKSFSMSRGASLPLVRGLSEYLVRRGILERIEINQSDALVLTQLGRTIIGGDWLGYFVFMVGGYGKVMRAAGALTRGEMQYGREIKRDGHYVALGSEMNGNSPHHRSFEAILSYASSGTQPKTVLDLGCGSSYFLVELMRRTQATQGIGIDLDETSCQLSKTRLAEAGMLDRVSIFTGDARTLLETRPDLESSVDLITALFLVHEFFGDGFPVAAHRLREICRTLRPGAGRFLILDKHTDRLDAGEPLLYFSEFKWVHDLTNQVLCDRKQWHLLLEEAGLEVLSEKVLAPHTGSILFDCRRKAG